MTRTETQSEQHLQVYLTESTRIWELARGADPDAPVPGMEGEPFGELLRHLGSVARRVADWLRTQVPPQAWESEPVDAKELVDWYAAAADGLYAALSAHRPEEPCSSWYPEGQSYGFWWRRMAHEFTVHRVDAETALGAEPSLIAPELAADGVDEVLRVFLANPLRTAPARRLVLPPGSASVALRAGEHGWRVALDEGLAAVRSGVSRDVGAEVSGDPLDVYLWCWGRADASGLRIDGASEDAEALRRALVTATQ